MISVFGTVRARKQAYCYGIRKRMASCSGRESPSKIWKSVLWALHGPGGPLVDLRRHIVICSLSYVEGAQLDGCYG